MIKKPYNKGDCEEVVPFFLQEKLVWRKKKGTSYIITEGEREMRKTRETQGFFVQFENKFA